jgi:hypothetical protein
MKQVLSELPLLHPLSQVLVSGSNNPHIELNLLRAADSRYGLRLKDLEEA